MKRIILTGVLAVLLSVTSSGREAFAQESEFQSLTEAAERSDAGEPSETAEVQQPSSSTIRATASAGVTLTFFTDRNQFDATCPNLLAEDFELANVGAFGVIGCPRPADNTNNNACFLPGDIIPGLSVTTIGPSRSGIELAITGAGFGGTTSKDIFANTFVDHLSVDFTAGNVTGVGMDLLSLFAADANLQIDIFGTSGLLGSTTAPGTNAGTFLGVSSNQVITQITIRSLINTAEGVDNVAFGACIIEVDIDLKPESNPNCVNPDSGGLISVAIFGTADFDVTTIDETSLTFGGAPVKRCRIEDALMEGPTGVFSQDGINDLVCKFKKIEADLPQSGDDCAEVELAGNLVDGTRLSGSDLACVPGDDTCNAGVPIPLP